MFWINTTFKEYCKKQGYDLMKDDLKFIEKTLRCLPTHTHRPLLMDYCQIWQKAMNDEPNAIRKQSQGRRAANLFLLKQTGKL